MNIHRKIHILVFLAFFAVPFVFAGATVQDDIDAKNRLLEEYQRQMEEYIQEAEKAGTQSKTLQNEILPVLIFGTPELCTSHSLKIIR